MGSAGGAAAPAFAGDAAAGTDLPDDRRQRGGRLVGPSGHAVRLRRPRNRRRRPAGGCCCCWWPRPPPLQPCRRCLPAHRAAAAAAAAGCVPVGRHAGPARAGASPQGAPPVAAAGGVGGRGRSRVPRVPPSLSCGGCFCGRRRLPRGDAAPAERAAADAAAAAAAARPSVARPRCLGWGRRVGPRAGCCDGGGGLRRPQPQSCRGPQRPPRGGGHLVLPGAAAPLPPQRCSSHAQGQRRVSRRPGCVSDFCVLKAVRNCRCISEGDASLESFLLAGEISSGRSTDSTETTAPLWEGRRV